jgi:hypothetical protein
VNRRLVVPRKTTAAGDRLGAFLANWSTSRTWWAQVDGRWSTPDEIARELLEEVGFVELRLADWLASPEDVLLRTVVIRALPPLQRAQAQLLITAIELAADAQRRRDRDTMLAWTVVSGVVLVFILAALWNLPRR